MRVRFQADADLNLAILLAVVVPQHLPISVVVDELLLIWGATEREEWINLICYLPL